MLSKEYKQYVTRISTVVSKNRIFTSKAETLAYGTDASFYRLIPKIVIQSKSVEEVSFLLAEATALGLPVTFRAAGTSLSGQAITDSILIFTAQHWTQHSILDHGNKIKLEPGVIGGRANIFLKPYGRKIGPDPASINAAMIGGIAANNASGMCCGTAQNSYKTVADMRIVFYDGTVLDTADAQSINVFKTKHAAMYTRLATLAAATQADTALNNRITEKYKMKNTTGYSLNALVDYTDPIEVIKHLMIGSEGTLGMIADITYNTVVEHSHKASSLMIFSTIEDACNAVTLLKNAPVAAVELMDRASLRSVENREGVPSYLPTLSVGASAILVETRASSEKDLNLQIEAVKKAIISLETELPIAFTAKPDEYSKFWKIRKGLFPSVGAMRKSGTTVIIEDVTFPVPRLAEATLDLQALCAKYNYDDAVIFGHALEGNLHFVFTQAFKTEAAIKEYDHFMKGLADLVVDKYDGALKAEHGTGRNMAPFVEKEWGPQAFALMHDIKNIFDPKGILNPGVILNPDKNSHLKNLKPLTTADAIIDKCVECGFCEPSCVSHGLTFSPRQRIVLHREIALLLENGDEAAAKELSESIHYGFDETCATDGLCALSCPVKIDTGAYVKKLRSAEKGANKTAVFIAKHLAGTSTVAKAALKAGHFTAAVVGDSTVNKMAHLAGQSWSKNVPKAVVNALLPLENNTIEGQLNVVYFSTCINRTMGVSATQEETESVQNATQRILKKAKCNIIYPPAQESLCCGMAFSSQGYTDAAAVATEKLKKSLLAASNQGEYPILCDMSPCLYTLKLSLKEAGLKLYDITEFTLDYLTTRLAFKPIDEEVAIFSVCSLKKMGLEESLYQLANLCSTKVHMPQTNCCGFAGNKGFNTPELNAHGLQDLKAQIPKTVTTGYATSRTCEIGLSEHSGIDFKSITNLIDKATQPK